jgi:hypothetical protein
MTQKPGCDYLLFDITNLLYRTFYVQTGEDDRTLAGLATHMALTMLNKYYKAYKPRKGVVMAFDRSSWRKKYTASEACVSKRPYKGDRRQEMTQSQQAKYSLFLEHLADFENLIINHTTIVTLFADLLEADDLIGGFVQLHPDDEIVLISTDTDMLQLLGHPGLTIVSPNTGEAVDLKDYDNNADYYLFTKCIRGDSTDNVQSAYPRVRATRIKAAYDDPYELVKLLKETWTNEKGETMVVEDLYEENRLLIDLRCQPDNIRNRIDDTITTAMGTKKKFSYFHLMKFIGKYELHKIGDSIDQYLPMLSK